MTSPLHDRAYGALLGSAVGDALGVPYEFESRKLLPGEDPEMLGGGLGNFAPGEWSDDTAMATVIAQVASTGADLRSDDALDAIATGFLDWFTSGPPDVGVQTSRVLSATRRRLRDEPAARPGTTMREESLIYASLNPRSAGNGALMRTGPVALAHLHDPVACATAARAIAQLTHADKLAVESCIIWSEAIRIAITEGRFEFRAGIAQLEPDSASTWNDRITDAETKDPNAFTPNGFTVTALQAAIAAITQTPFSAECPRNHFRDALYTAIRIGNDTDTVAAIAGAVLGARWGAAVIPAEWAVAVHGWPVRGTLASDASRLETWAHSSTTRL